MRNVNDFLNTLLIGSLLYFISCIALANFAYAGSCVRPMRPSCDNSSSYCVNAWRDYERAMDAYADCVERGARDDKPGYRNPGGNGLNIWQD